jgi:hypothetical protein
MDKNENLRDLRAELAGSRLTPAERAEAAAQVAAATGTSTAPADQVNVISRSRQRTTSGDSRPTDPTIEAAVSAVESRAATETSRPPAATASTPGIGAAASTGTAPSTPTKDPVRDLVNQLAALETRLAGSDPHLAQAVRQLAETARQGKSTATEQFQTSLAYALQDAERIVGPLPDVPQGLREQMALLATTQRGLHNERLQALLRDTPNIADSELVGVIRRNANTAAQAEDQHSSKITNRIDRLVEWARQAPRVDPAPNPWVASSGANHAPTTLEHTPTTPPHPPTDPSQQDRRQALQTQGVVTTSHATGPRGLLSIFRGLRNPGAPAREPWDSPLTPLGPHVAAFDARLTARNEERQLAEAERAGRAALDALRHFSQGPGASVLNKIRDAARTEPAGFHGVMTEMREGGKYADLRKEFNAALATERGLGAAYDTATVALSQYGAQRTAADAIISRRPDAKALANRFEQIDADLGHAASTIPGRKDGKSALDEVADKAREIVTKAVDAIRSMFGRQANATAAPSAGASPAPVP